METVTPDKATQNLNIDKLVQWFKFNKNVWVVHYSSVFLLNDCLTSGLEAFDSLVLPNIEVKFGFGNCM